MAERFNPIKSLTAELERANGDLPLQYTQEEWLIELGLDGEEPDGCTLLDRFSGSEGGIRQALFLFRTAPALIGAVMGLVETVGSDTYNPNQDQFGRTLASIATKQIQREGDICPTGEMLAVAAYVRRPDYFPEDMHPTLDWLTAKQILRQMENS